MVYNGKEAIQEAINIVENYHKQVLICEGLHEIIRHSNILTDYLKTAIENNNLNLNDDEIKKIEELVTLLNETMLDIFFSRACKEQIKLDKMTLPSNDDIKLYYTIKHEEYMNS